MAEAIKRILTDAVLAQTLSFNARSKAEEFDWSKVGPKWKAILDSCSSQSRGSVSAREGPKFSKPGPLASLVENPFAHRSVTPALIRNTAAR